MDYKSEMKQLRDILNEAGYRYYVLDDPAMDDYDYDRLLRKLEELEAAHPEEVTPDSPTQRVGGEALESFQQVVHPVPLESLQDVFSPEEVEEFAQRMMETLETVEYSVEPKVDGLSVALEYRNGLFVQGATRGDGQVGEDVTENLRTIKSIPMTLPDKLPRLIVRGEVFMPKNVFHKLNRQREEMGSRFLRIPAMLPLVPCASSTRRSALNGCWISGCLTFSWPRERPFPLTGRQSAISRPRGSRRSPTNCWEQRRKSMGRFSGWVKTGKICPLIWMVRL